MRLEQTSYRFSESTLFERIALHDAMIHGAANGPRRLREALLGQTAPVIEALHDWSRMTRPGLWGAGDVVLGRSVPDHGGEASSRGRGGE